MTIAAIFIVKIISCDFHFGHDSSVIINASLISVTIIKIKIILFKVVNPATSQIVNSLFNDETSKDSQPVISHSSLVSNFEELPKKNSMTLVLI